MDCRFQVVDAKKVALQNFLAPTNKKVTLTNDPNNADDNDNDNTRDLVMLDDNHQWYEYSH